MFLQEMPRACTQVKNLEATSASKNASIERSIDKMQLHLTERSQLQQEAEETEEPEEPQLVKFILHESLDIWLAVTVPILPL